MSFSSNKRKLLTDFFVKRRGSDPYVNGETKMVKLNSSEVTQEASSIQEPITIKLPKSIEKTENTRKINSDWFILYPWLMKTESGTLVCKYCVWSGKNKDFPF